MAVVEPLSVVLTLRRDLVSVVVVLPVVDIGEDCTDDTQTFWEIGGAETS